MTTCYPKIDECAEKYRYSLQQNYFCHKEYHLKLATIFTIHICQLLFRQNKTLVVSLGLNKNWTDEQTRWGLKLVYSLVSSV